MSFCASSVFFFFFGLGESMLNLNGDVFFLLLCSELRILEVLDQRVCLDFVEFLSNWRSGFFYSAIELKI